ncbi:unnamed protein product [Rotaria sordida]|uniref:Uncharacterized protein n=1 Tax=Rotaria sordida TaxID=392033 RepID=A0A814BW09_9BILA|nr:unnamed protein product [Rotaria sordida]CAF0998455.1 unnamed protein product [Rotaria sordida]
METIYSNLNSVIKFDRRRSITTTSDVGESLCDDDDDDLEWDKSDFNRHLPESDALSSYDLNEMAEILRNRFLEFDMSSQIDECSTPFCQSTINDIVGLISNQDLQKENFLRNHSISSIITFNYNYLNKNQIIKHRLYRSLSNLNLIKQKKKSYFLLSKHLSLMNIKSIKWKFLKHTIPCTNILTKINYHKSFGSIPQSESELINKITNINISRLSKLDIFRSYLIQLREKTYSFILQIFQSTKIPPITEETIETYDIIEG